MATISLDISVDYLWINTSGDLEWKTRIVKDYRTYKIMPNGSKEMVAEKQLPTWSFRTNMNSGATIELLPVRHYKNPFVDGNCVIAICDYNTVYSKEVKVNSNYRKQLAELLCGTDFSIGIKQEYVPVSGATTFMVHDAIDEVTQKCLKIKSGLEAIYMRPNKRIRIDIAAGNSTDSIDRFILTRFIFERVFRRTFVDYDARPGKTCVAISSNSIDVSAVNDKFKFNTSSAGMIYTSKDDYVNVEVPGKYVGGYGHTEPASTDIYETTLKVVRIVLSEKKL